MSGIYLIWNTVSGGIYVGSSTCIRQRIQTHIRELNAGTHFNPHLQSAWRLYGSHVFSALCVEEVEPTRLIERENEWLVFGTYNIARVAGRPSGTLGYNFTIEQRQRLSKALRGRKMPSDQSDRIKAGLTIEVRARMSAMKQGHRPPSWSGREHNETTRAKMRVAQHARRQRETVNHV